MRMAAKRRGAYADEESSPQPRCSALDFLANVPVVICGLPQVTIAAKFPREHESPMAGLPSHSPHGFSSHTVLTLRGDHGDGKGVV
jgi:hypothetical protein